jgi:hypothetical protein
VQTQVDAKIAKSTVTAKGDLLVATGSGTVVAQPIGTDGQFLKANSAQSDGVEWATVSQYALPSQTGNSGKFLTTNGTSESWGTASQAINWTRRLSATGVAFTSIVYGNGVWVATGDTGQLYSSSNGTTWTSRTSQFGTTSILFVNYGNGVFVAVGSSGKISTSTDGTTWTARTSNMGTNDINHVIYANSLWVAVGSGGGTTNTGGITYSSDNGATWTRKSQSFAIGPNYQQSLWNGTNWIVVSSIDTGYNYLYATTPSGTWTRDVHTGGENIGIIISDGTRTIIAKSGDYWYTTTGTTLATTTTISQQITTNSNPNLTKAYNGSVYRLRNGYLHVFSFTTGASYVTHDNFYLLPTSYLNQGGTVTNSALSLSVGAEGMVLVNNQGSIYTSF